MKMFLSDGSGLSRYSLLTPDYIVKLLFNVQQADFFKAFEDSLPIAGIDGTLKERMTKTSAQAKVKAKTGSLGGISALSGYLITQDNEKLVFSIMINGFVGPALKYKNLEDKICIYLTEFSRSN